MKTWSFYPWRELQMFWWLQWFYLNWWLGLLHLEKLQDIKPKNFIYINSIPIWYHLLNIFLIHLKERDCKINFIYFEYFEGPPFESILEFLEDIKRWPLYSIGLKPGMSFFVFTPSYKCRCRSVLLKLQISAHLSTNHRYVLTLIGWNMSRRLCFCLNK